jgi:regulatory protein
LHRRGVADHVVAEVLDRYAEVGMIDDQAFARAWISSRHHRRGLARPALAVELRRKGVATDTVRKALDDLDSDTERATARSLVQRRLRVERRDDAAALARRLVGMLARKGYPAVMAYEVVKEALAADARTSGAAKLIDTDAVDDMADG